MCNNAIWSFQWPLRDTYASLDVCTFKTRYSCGFVKVMAQIWQSYFSMLFSYELISNGSSHVYISDLHWIWKDQSEAPILTQLTNAHIDRYKYDDVMAWKRFPYHWPFVREEHPSLVNPLANDTDACWFLISYLVLAWRRCSKVIFRWLETPWCSCNVIAMCNGEVY